MDSSRDQSTSIAGAHLTPVPGRPGASIAFCGRYLDVIWEERGEYTHNRRCRGVVLVIPVTTAREIVFIEQYRIALQAAVIEYPAGLVGDEDDDETFESAARRELLEESGYEAETLELVLRGPSSPGSSTEVVDFYIARGARRVSDKAGVAHERIRVHTIMLDDALAWLEAKAASGVLVDPRVQLGVYLAGERL
jgi:ADP-ribose pyrophosphatase